jgi:hypothetical protein
MRIETKNAATARTQNFQVLCELGEVLTLIEVAVRSG